MHINSRDVRRTVDGGGRRREERGLNHDYIKSPFIPARAWSLRDANGGVGAATAGAAVRIFQRGVTFFQRHRRDNESQLKRKRLSPTCGKSRGRAYRDGRAKKCEGWVGDNRSRREASLSGEGAAH